MTPVDQDKFGAGTGNCFSACIATVFDLPLSKVPEFCVGAKDDEWWRPFSDWCLERGLRPMGLRFPNLKAVVDDYLPDVLLLAGGPSPREGVLHSVVYRGSTMIWDPHPSREGLTSWDDVIVFVAVNPGVAS